MAQAGLNISSHTSPETLGFLPDALKRFRPWMTRYLDEGRLPGALLIIARRGEVALLESLGLSDLESGKSLQPDAIFRFYSMAKPVTAMAVLQLHERGALSLDAPLADYMPAFARMEVLLDESGPTEQTRPSRRAVTILNLLTHRSGLTYGVLNDSPLAKAYRDNKLDFGPRDGPNAEVIQRLAAQPLLCEPGGLWRYGVSFDVLGHLVELVSGRSLADYLQAEVFGPLGMVDSGFTVADSKLDRFASLYRATEEGGMELVEDAQKSNYREGLTTLSGGAGLISTASDYLRFAEMLRNGGQLAGERILSPDSIALMTLNHLSGELSEIGDTSFSESSLRGFGFGLGVSVMLDPSRAGVPGTPGEFAWGGAASTAFFVDPAEELTVMFLTQLLPSNRYPIRRELRTLTYQALDR